MEPTTLNSRALTASDRAHNLLVGDDVAIDESARIGANVVIYDGVRIGPGVTIKHNCVIGERPSVAPDSHAGSHELGVTLVEAGATICNSVVMMAGAVVGERTIIGDQVMIREGVHVAEDCVIGRGCLLAVGVQIGARTKMQAMCTALPDMVIEQDVRFGAAVTGASNRWSEPDSKKPAISVLVRRGARIGSAACLLAGIEIGAGALVAAGAVVSASVAPGTTVVGVPARAIATTGDV